LTVDILQKNLLFLEIIGVFRKKNLLKNSD